MKVFVLRKTNMSYARLSAIPTMFSSGLDQPRRPTSYTYRKKLLYSYAVDWLLTLALAGVFFSLDAVTGFRRHFSLEDKSLLHPYAVHERVPNWALALICFVVPLVLQFAISYLTDRSWWDVHNATLGLTLSLATTGAVTQFVKITAGRPRPDFIDRCQPPANATDPQFGLSTWTICTQTDSYILKDGFRSFFSGHSSLSFAGLGFLSFYLAGKVHLFDKRGHTGKTWLALSPFSAAALVAISRTMDYRHHWHDVFVGSIVGTTLAYFCYRQYYPSLSSDVSHLPYGPRIKEEEEILPLHTESHGTPLESHTRYADDDGGAAFPNHSYELSGTVPRPDLGPMEEMWNSDGSGELTVPEHSHHVSGH